MAYRDNVTTLAKKYGLSNDPGLQEEDLEIAALIFSFPHVHGVHTKRVDATSMNRGGRLFFEDLAVSANRQLSLTIDESVRERAKTYFAELWEEVPVLGKRPLIDAIRTAVGVDIVWKSDL